MRARKSRRSITPLLRPVSPPALWHAQSAIAREPPGGSRRRCHELRSREFRCRELREAWTSEAAVVCAGGGGRRFVSSYCCICFLVLLYMCPHTTIHVSSYYSISSGLIQLYICPHASMYVSSYYYMWPHTTTHVFSY